MQVGTVERFDSEKGYGFLQNEGGRRFFFHWKNILMEGYRALIPGDAVQFEEGRDERGRVQAIEVRRF
jgi:CspA family cold shock protein